MALVRVFQHILPQYAFLFRLSIWRNMASAPARRGGSRQANL
jgi:hypothetical protein